MKQVSSTLICTNHLFMWAGSELVAIELAEELLRRGIDVALFATLVDRDFLKSVFGTRVAVHDRADAVDLAHYDLVFAQHHVFPLILNAALARGPIGAGPFLVWNHLSPSTPLEAPGPCVEVALADAILANSAETLSMLAVYGRLFEAARLWPNPAPAEFSCPLAEPAELGFLAVSNHAVAQLDKAFDLLERQGHPLRRIGQPHLHERVRPSHLAQARGVITIGKTVQYALRAGRPVYCYGPHGGPGWLAQDNYAAARKANFSGRSHPQKKTAEEIAQELLAGMPAAAEFHRSLDPAAEGFCLETLVDGLLNEAGARLCDRAWQSRRCALLASAEIRHAVALEANLANAIRAFYLKCRSPQLPRR